VNAVWIAAALLTAGFVGWPVTALVFRLARTIDDKADAAVAGRDGADDPSADVTVDSPAAEDRPATADRGNTVNGDITVDAGAAAAPDAKGEAPATRILRGGAIIGVLERLAVCLAILAGHRHTRAQPLVAHGGRPPPRGRAKESQPQAQLHGTGNR